MTPFELGFAACSIGLLVGGLVGYVIGRVHGAEAILERIRRDGPAAIIDFYGRGQRPPRRNPPAPERVHYANGSVRNPPPPADWIRPDPPPAPPDGEPHIPQPQPVRRGHGPFRRIPPNPIPDPPEAPPPPRKP